MSDDVDVLDRWVKITLNIVLIMTELMTFLSGSKKLRAGP